MRATVPIRSLSRRPTRPPPNEPARGAAGAARASRAGERSSAEPGDCGAAANPPPPPPPRAPCARQSLARTTTMPPCSATSLALPQSTPFQMCTTVMVMPLPGPSATRAMLPTSSVSMDPSTALSPRVFTLRRMSCRRAGRTSGRSTEDVCIISTAASFSTLTTMPTDPSSSITRSCVPYSPTLSTRRLASATSARWCENTTNSSFVTSPNTVATSPSTFTTSPDSPSCLPCTHRTCDPSLNDFRRWSRSMSSAS